MTMSDKTKAFLKYLAVAVCRPAGMRQERSSRPEPPKATP